MAYKLYTDKQEVFECDLFLEGADLKNPLNLSDEWSVIEEELLGEDILIIAEKGVECLQEL